MSNLAIDNQNSVWAAAPGTGQGTLVGRNATTPVGFFGATPIARPVVPTAATGTQLAAALAALGLVTLS